MKKESSLSIKCGEGNSSMLYVIFAVVKKNHIVNKVAYPWSMTVGRLVGAGYTVFFAYFIYTYFAGEGISSDFAIYAGTTDYLFYVIIGSAFYTFAKAILMGVGRAPMLEVREGTIENVIISPCSRMAYLLGQYLEQFLRASFEMVIVILVGMIMGMRLKNIHWGTLVLVLIIASVSLFSMGVALSSLMMYMRDTFITQNTVFHLIALLCGVSFPPEYLPGIFSYLGQCLPFTPALSLVRASLNGEPLDLRKLFWILGFSMVYLIIGMYWFKRSEQLLSESLFA